MNDPILEFQREYRFLSNFYPAPFTYKGQEYPSVEHAYQALKCVNKSDHDFIVTSCTPGGAKRHVRKVAQKEGFHDNKLELMSTLVSLKFIYNKDLAKKLLETGDSELIEGNWWGDKYWGVFKGEGENHLGKILMAVRDRLRKGQSSDPSPEG